MEEVIKGFKGFRKDMTAKQNNFQYEEGKEYETDRADVCNSGFHACEYPLDCFKYYDPAESVFHEVEQTGEFSRNYADSKVASTKIKIGTGINIVEMVKAAIEYTRKKIDEKRKFEEKTRTLADSPIEERHVTGYRGASNATGYCGASSATGNNGASSATGIYGASNATGNNGASSVAHPNGIAVSWGYKGKAKGVTGSHLVLAEWEKNNRGLNVTEFWILKCAKMVQVDGESIKENTWYTMENGEIVEAEEE